MKRRKVEKVRDKPGPRSRNVAHCPVLLVGTNSRTGSHNKIRCIDIHQSLYMSIRYVQLNTVRCHSILRDFVQVVDGIFPESFQK